VIFQWQPFNRITLVEGDSSVTHSGAKNGLEMGEMTIQDQSLIPDSLRDLINDALKDI
jgi:hypothetical protein